MSFCVFLPLFIDLMHKSSCGHIILGIYLVASYHYGLAERIMKNAEAGQAFNISKIHTKEMYKLIHPQPCRVFSLCPWVGGPPLAMSEGNLFNFVGATW